MNHPEFAGMVPLRCQLCNAEVGLKPKGYEPDPDMVVVRCYACAATEAAEEITKEAAS